VDKELKVEVEESQRESSSEIKKPRKTIKWAPYLRFNEEFKFPKDHFRKKSGMGPAAWTAEYHKTYGALKIAVTSVNDHINPTDIQDTPNMDEILRAVDEIDDRVYLIQTL